jgi:hypothetical protein
MEPGKDMPGESTCTTCTFADDFCKWNLHTVCSGSKVLVSADPVCDCRSELLDRCYVFPRKERDVQTRVQHRKQPVRKSERRLDGLLHAGRHLRLEPEIERDSL